jgi:hypothetical protein
MKIGKHLWRISVDETLYLGNCTVYEFLRISPYPQDMQKCFWQNEKSWPSWNGNDTFLGLPKGLYKLWALNKPKFKHLLKEGE